VLSTKNADGVEIFSSTEKQFVAGTSTLSVSTHRIALKTTPTSLVTFSNKNEVNRNISGNATLTTDPRTYALNHEYSVSVTIKPSSNTNIPGIVEGEPSNITVIWPQDFTDGTINYKSKMTSDAVSGSEEEIIYDITGISLDKIPADIAIRTVTSI
jgi:hypothetical protein